MVCSSKQNRSMEAHSLLQCHGFDVSSYGTGAHVKLPGPSYREPNIYEFGTPYHKMYDDLLRKNPELYKRNGILPMLKRNMSVKLAPQRWQDNAADGPFDVVLGFDDRVFDAIVDGLMVELLACILLLPILLLGTELSGISHFETVIQQLKAQAEEESRQEDANDKPTSIS